MITRRQNKKWASAVERQFSRLNDRQTLFPYPAAVSFGLALILFTHFSLELNPRLGNPVEALPFATEQNEIGNLWFSVYVRDEKLVIRTLDRRLFKIPLNEFSIEDFSEFQAYLEEYIREKTMESAVSFDFEIRNTTAVFSVDQRLRYTHIRPLIYILAKVGITRYGFETQLSEQTSKNRAE